MTLVVRRERPEDEREISEVVKAAFGDASVAEFTESIRASAGYVSELTFVGEDDGEIVGFTMLSYVGIEDSDARLLTLTPMAVRPDRQRQGVGIAIVEAVAWMVAPLRSYDPTIRGRVISPPFFPPPHDA
jgi:putative acetyltransferase